MNPTEPQAEYTTPQLIVYGNVEDLTRGGVDISTNDLPENLQISGVPRMPRP